MNHTLFQAPKYNIIQKLMSEEASIVKSAQISLPRQSVLRSSYKKGDKRSKMISGLKKSQHLSHSRKTMIKNGSSQTFETELPVKSFEKVFDQSQIFGFETGSNLLTYSKQRWSIENKNRVQNSQQAQRKTFNRHRKAFSVSGRPSIHGKQVKTQSSLGEHIMPISIENFIKEVKFNRLSLSRSIQVPQPALTINQVMINKFYPRRKYEDSKIIRHNILPSFLNFSISKCKINEKAMVTTISSNLFKRHEISFDNKSIFD